MKLPLPAWLVRWIVARAAQQPFHHLEGYMERYWLVSPKSRLSAWLRQHENLCQWRDVRVHKILRSDKDGAHHDHPWDFWRVILDGGYTEVTQHDNYGDAMAWIRREGAERDPTVLDNMAFNAHMRKWEVRIRYAKGHVALRRADFFHRVELAPGETATTLFVMGKYRQKWGYSTPAGKVPHDAYHPPEEVAQRRAAIDQAYNGVAK